MWILNRFTPPSLGRRDAGIRGVEEVLDVLGGLELVQVGL
jgi:hypothetical protein